MQGTQYATKRSILCRGAFCGPTVLHLIRLVVNMKTRKLNAICYQRSILCRVGTYVISVVVRGYTICSS